MASDPILLRAFRRQCRTVGPGIALLAWQGQEGVDPDDMLDIAKDVEREQATEHR